MTAGVQRPRSAPRSVPLWVAAGVTGVIALVHPLVGTPETLGPLLGADLEPVPAQTLRVVWHTMSVLLATFPVALAWAARADPVVARPVLAYVWTLCAGFAVVFLLVGVDAFGADVLTLPQWILFLPPLVLIPLGARHAVPPSG